MCFWWIVMQSLCKLFCLQIVVIWILISKLRIFLLVFKYFETPPSLWSRRLYCWLETNCLSLRLFISSSHVFNFFSFVELFASKFSLSLSTVSSQSVLCLWCLHAYECSLPTTFATFYGEEGSQDFCDDFFHWQFSFSLLFLVVCRKGRENFWNWIVIQSVPNFSWSDNKTGWFNMVTTDKAVFVWYQVFSFYSLNTFFFRNSEFCMRKSMERYPWTSFSMICATNCYTAIDHFDFIQRCRNKQRE